MTSLLINLYDTTLRDGCQAHGFTLSVEDKLRVARRLDDLGFHYVEGGWPGSNPRDEEFFARARRIRFQNAKLAAFGSTRRSGIMAKEDPSLRLLIEAGTPVATIVGKASADQVAVVLGIAPEENLDLIADSVAYLKGAGREVIFDAEHFFDGYAVDPAYSLSCIRAAEAAGADWIVLCDTNGGTLPVELDLACRDAISAINTPIGIHTHNDCEVAVANALIAVRAGARQVQGTINGYGERTGNANLCSIIPNLQLKCGYGGLPPESLERLTELSRYVSEIGAASHSLKLPYVGEEAFAHKAGLHVNAVLKGARTYEHVAPESVGNRRHVLVSDLSGKGNLRHKLGELGIRLSSEQMSHLLQQLKRREHQGAVYEDADASFELLALRSGGQHIPSFYLVTYSVVTKNGTSRHCSQATVKIRVGKEHIISAAEGVGPVHALDGALRKALMEFYPHLAAVKLLDYKVRVVDNESGTGARVRVWIQASDGNMVWATVGTSPNIVTASAHALLDSLEYALLNSRSAQFERLTG